MTIPNARTVAKSSMMATTVSHLSHMVVVPVAAWNHNLLLVVVAALFPMTFMMVLRKLGKLPKANISSRRWVKSLSILAALTAVSTFLFWNHLWFVALALVVVMVVSRTKIVTATR
jgi:hypothetical protein